MTTVDDFAKHCLAAISQPGMHYSARVMEATTFTLTEDQKAMALDLARKCAEDVIFRVQRLETDCDHGNTAALGYALALRFIQVVLASDATVRVMSALCPASDDPNIGEKLAKMELQLIRMQLQTLGEDISSSFDDVTDYMVANDIDNSRQTMANILAKYKEA